MTDAEINRMVARLVARNLGHQATDAEVLAEARATERYPCSDGEMLALCRAEIARHSGRVTGGYVTAAKRRRGLRRRPPNRGDWGGSLWGADGSPRRGCLESP